MASVASRNIFDMLEDDVSETNTVKAPAPAPAAPAAAPAAAKKEAPKPAPAKKDERPEGAGRGRGRGGPRPPRGDGETRREEDRRPPRERGERPPRRGGRGGGAPRHQGEGGESRDYQREHNRDRVSTKGEREFDRHSRSGPGSERSEKRDGRGAHNWGDPVSAVETADAEAEVPDVSEPREPTEEELAAQREREEEEKQMTLEEYRKKQAEARKTVEIQRRAANEGVDESQWKNTVLLTKNEEEIDPIFQEKEKKTGKKKSSKPAETDAKPELFKFKFNDEGRDNDRRRERGGFGDRERRGGERGGDRAPRRNAPAGKSGPAPAINDESAFPSLG